MKKIQCNVLYDAKLIATNSKIGSFKIDLGLFDDRRVALISMEILKQVSDENNNQFSYESKIEEFYVPDSKMSNPVIEKRLVKSINDFVSKNVYTEDFAIKNGQDKLYEIIEKAHNAFVKNNCNNEYEDLSK